MSRNIYDIFNERKNEAEVVVEESFDFADEYEASVDDEAVFEAAEAFESIEEACEVLDDMTKDCVNEWIEFEATQYLEELVIESMMYEHFVEEAAAEVVDNHEGGGKQSLLQQLQAQWQKIKDWFASLIKTLQNFFVNGQKLVAQNKATIPDAMKNCKAKVRMCSYYPFKMGMVNVAAVIGKALNVASKVKQPTKEYILKAAGLKDKKDASAVARKFFIKEEAKEMNVSDIDPKTAMDWCEAKNHIYDGFIKLRMGYDMGFQNMIAEVKKDSKGDFKELRARMSCLYFANSIRSEMVKVAASCSKQACAAYTAVIRKALGGAIDKPGKGKKQQGQPNPQMDVKQTKLQGSTESTSVFDDIDDIQFLDEEE